MHTYTLARRYQKSRIGRFFQAQERKQEMALLKKQAEALQQKGVITEKEMQAEVAKIEAMYKEP